eukprot:360946-Chlamydomonas_euryale.AAC.13
MMFPSQLRASCTACSASGFRSGSAANNVSKKFVVQRPLWRMLASFWETTAPSSVHTVTACGSF